MSKNIIRQPTRIPRERLYTADPLLAETVTEPLYRAHNYLAYNAIGNLNIASCFYAPDDTYGAIGSTASPYRFDLYPMTSGPALPDSSTRRLMLAMQLYGNYTTSTEFGKGRYVLLDDDYTNGDPWAIYDDGIAKATAARYYGDTFRQRVVTIGASASTSLSGAFDPGMYDVGHDGNINAHKLLIGGLQVASVNISYVPWPMSNDDYLMDSADIAAGQVVRGWINGGDKSLGDLVHAIGPSSGAGSIANDLMTTHMSCPYFQVLVPHGQWHDNTSYECVFSSSQDIYLPIRARNWLGVTTGNLTATPAIMLLTSGHTNGCKVKFTSQVAGDSVEYTTVAGDAYSANFDETPNLRTLDSLDVFDFSVDEYEYVKVEIDCESGVELLWRSIALFPDVEF